MTLVAFPPLPTRLTTSSSSSSSSTATHQTQPHTSAAYELDQLRPPPTPPPPTSTPDTTPRSRASSLVSSLISTGTRFSITTLPQPPLRTIDSAILAEDSTADGIMGDGSGNMYDNTIAMTTNNVAVAGNRPPSLYSYSDSVRSTSTSLPPYELESDISHGAAFARGLGVPGETAENLISRHYGNVVRTIDANHQRLLARTVQGHERELAQMRDAMDKLYRREFAAREREVERVREGAAAAGREGARRIEGLEREVEALRAEIEVGGKRVGEVVEEMSRGFAGGVERACYVVEEVWERRWGDRLRVEGEEGERRVRRRDEEWVAVLERERVGLGEEMRRVMGVGVGKEESGCEES